MLDKIGIQDIRDETEGSLTQVKRPRANFADSSEEQRTPQRNGKGREAGAYVVSVASHSAYMQVGKGRVEGCAQDRSIGRWTWHTLEREVQGRGRSLW
jgi:hypothetical protein